MKNNNIAMESISIKQAAQYVGVSVRTIRNWMEKDEDFPRRFKRYGTLRFRKSEVEEYWAKNSRKRR